MKTADRFATAGAGRLVPDYCLAIIDGGPFFEPLWVIDAADIETMEVYASRGRSRRHSLNVSGAGAAGRGARTRLPPQGPGCDASVYIWLRK